MANFSLMKYLYRILFDERLAYKKEEFWKACGKSQLVCLWKILFETEIDDTKLLEERIYEFGSRVKEKDYLGREVFVCLDALLHLVIKEKT